MEVQFRWLVTGSYRELQYSNDGGETWNPVPEVQAEVKTS